MVNRRMTNASNEGKRFDYIVVGAGAAGSVLAAELSASGAQVSRTRTATSPPLRAGLGIAQIPAFVLKESMERGTLDLLLGDWFPEPSPLYVVYPQHRHLSAKVRVFVDWVAELLSEHDGIQLR